MAVDESGRTRAPAASGGGDAPPAVAAGTGQGGETSGVATLSPERRALVEALLAERRLDLARIPILPQGAPTDERGAPLAFTQERMWFLDRLAPGNPAFHITSSLLLSGELDLRRLGHCFDSVLDRHASLRSTFHEIEGEPRQRVAPPAPLPLPMIDLSALPPDIGRRLALRIGRRWSWTPFDLQQAPLVRVVVFRLGARLHTVQLTVHHLVADGWSMGIISREVGELYEALSRDRPSPHEPLPVQFPDFAHWQRRWLQGRILNDQLAAWRRQLDGAPPVQTLPLDRPRPPMPSPRGAALSFELPRLLRRRIETLARRRQATPFMVLLSAWQVLLYRLSGQRDLVVGTAIANRNRPETESLVGFFANTLALRAVVDGRQGFEVLLKAVRETALDAYDRQDLPFEKLVEVLDPDRDLSRSPLFQTMVLLQNAGGTGGPAAAAGGDRRRARLPGMEQKRRRLDSRSRASSVQTGVVQFDLTLVLEASGQIFLGALQYRRQLFDTTTAYRLVAAYQRLLAALVQDTHRSLDTIPWLDRVERHQVVHEWSTAPTLAPDEALPEVVLPGMLRDPGAPAVVTSETTWTHGELLAAAQSVATVLRHSGVGLETPVAVCLDRTPWLVAGLLGVSLSGATAIPIDPAYPEDRRRHMLAASAAKHLLSRRAVASDLGLEADSETTLVWVDESNGAAGAGMEGIGEAQGLTQPRSVAQPDSLAYVLFTSGSTGIPKGVAIPHRGPAALVRWALTTYSAEELAAVAATTSICFDLSVFELFVPLAAGGTVVLLRDALALVEGADTEGAAADARDDTEIDPGSDLDLRLLNTVPSVLAEILRQGALPKTVDTVNLAGEALERRLVAELAESGQVERVLNLYGPSEDTTYSTGTPVPFTPENRWPPSIGRPLAGGQLWLVDRTLRPVALGGQGEIVLAGAGLARGYLGQPARTAEVFVPGPWGPSGGRLYRTGDLARWGADGRLHFLGRIDHQVKVRGFRIEPGEIETALVALAPGIEAAVVAAEGRLVAFLGTGPEPDVVSAESLRTALAERLPAHLVPAAFETLDALPRLPNGKIDRATLTRQARAVEAAGIDTTPPANPLEAQVAEIFAEVLERPSVGTRASFFELGGHSLLAVRVIARLRSVFGLELPLRTVFEAPTVATLARQVERARWSAQGTPRPPLEAGPRPERVPLTFAQERMWFLERLMPGTGTYNLPLAVRLTGTLDLAALTQALAWVVERHEGLRTRFVDHDGQPWQQVADRTTVELSMVDLSALNDAERDPLRNTLLRAETLRPFDLARDLPWRAQVLRLAEDQWVVLVVFHHIAADGVSLAVFEREIGLAYRAAVADETPQVPPLPVQMADVAVWQRGWLQGEVLEHHVEVWRRRLAGAPPLLELPTDRPRPPVPSGRGASRPFRFGDAASALGAWRQSTGATTTPFLAVATLVQALLARWSGSRAVVVGTPVAGRSEVEVEGLVGLFVNTLVLRGEVAPDLSFNGLLDQVRDRLLEAHEHRHLPFEKLVDELGVERSLAHGPIFQTLVLVEEGMVTDPTAGPEERDLAHELRARPMAIESRRAKFDLTFAVLHQGDHLGGVLTYATDLFDATTVERWARGFARLLAAVLENPDAALASHTLWSTAERHQQLVEWNDRGALETPTPIPLQVVRQASTQPEAIAVRAGDASTTYGELLEQSSRVARTLRLGGAGVESRVAVRMERTPRLVAALLGVLRVGAAYVPIDPAYPPARQRLMLDDSAARWLLVDGLDERAEDWLPGWLAEQGSEAPEVLPWDAVQKAEPGLELAQEAPDLDSLAYVLYTSGSTGVPKGVAIPHRGPAALVDWARTVVPDSELAALVAPTSVCFDLSVFELFAPLAAGGTVQLVPDALHLPDETAQPALVNTVPSVLDEGLSATSLAPTVSTVSLAGEPLRGALVRRIFDETEAERVLNLYGPSEDTTYSTGWSIQREDAATLGEPTVGRPILGKRAHVCGPDLRLQPLGVVGELCLSGVGLARGYLDRPATTATVFVPDPFSLELGGRLYRTGDLARRLGDGELELLGRRDHQVKVRGFRIELEEIEARLLGHPSVAAAAVVATASDTSADDRRLVAWLVPTAEASFSEASLRTQLATELPHYLVPSRFETVDALPQTSSGKIDRRALASRRLRAMGASEEAPFVAPRTVFEELVADLWREVLGVERVSTAADFFSLGGHSLLATRLVARLERDLGFAVPVRWVFEAPTVQRLATRLESLRRDQADGAVTGPPPLTHEPDAPAALSFAQERLWFLEQLRPGTAAYNMPQALRLDGPLVLPALDTALRTLVARHEPLRTRVVLDDGEPRAVVDPAPAVDWRVPVVDLSSLVPDARQPVLDALLRAGARRPFRLDRDPPWRATLFRLGDDDHALAWTLHHLVADGESLELLRREWGMLYTVALTAGSDRVVPTPLPALPITYSDYARWQRDWLQGEVLEAEIDHWRHQLAAAPELLELPTDRRRPPVPSARGGTLRWDTSATTREALDSLARRHGATRFMVVLSAFQVFLARLSGQGTVAVGSPIAGRGRWQTEGLAGLFVNTLVFVGEMGAGRKGTDQGQDRDDHSPFEALLARTRDQVLTAHDHQDLPFEKLVEALVGVRRIDRNPLFQAALTVATPHAAPQSGIDGSEETELATTGPVLRVRPLGQGSEPAKFDLHLAVEGRGDGLSLALSYARDLFDATTIERWGRLLGRLLEALGEAPETPWDALPWLDRREAHQLVSEWCGDGLARTPAETQPSLLITRCLEHARQRPESPALTWGERAEATTTWTYGELAERSLQLAARLRQAGVSPDDRVGLLLDRGPALVQASLGTLASGGAFVPLDPAYPVARLAAMVEDAALRVVLVEPSRVDAWQTLAAALPETVTRPSLLVLDEETPDALPAMDPCPVEPGQLAYVIYTSGSTGRPKGVGIPHPGLDHFVAAPSPSCRLAPGDAVLQLASPSFDASVWELVTALSQGACLHTAPRQALLPGGPLEALLRARRVDWLFITPSSLAALDRTALTSSPHDSDDGSAPSNGALPRQLMVGGEASRPEGLLPWLEGGQRLANAYGPTEATVYVSAWEAEEPTLRQGRVGLGRPVAAARLRVVDRSGRPTPLGVAGELWIGGPGLARGYLGHPARTAEVFVPDPWGDTPGARIYRSGDRVRQWSDGSFEHLGRLDLQLKVRGLRVEAGEVESLLLADPGVGQAVAVVAGERPEEQRLVAYVAAESGEAPPLDLATLRQTLGDQLPGSLVPTVVLLDTLPTTPSGKVDRRALAARSLDAVAEVARDDVAPRNLLEELVAAVWCEVLGVASVRVEVDFFEVGGHSLLAARIASRMARDLDLEVPVRTVFEAPTVAALARWVAERRRQLEEDGPGRRIPPLERRASTDPPPLSFAQERLWFLEQLQPGTALYNIPTALRLDGVLDPAALRWALDALATRHEPLRTRYALVDGQPVQQIDPPGEVPLSWVDLRGLGSEQGMAVARQWLHRAAGQPIDVANEWPVRALVCQVDSTTHALALTLHHIAADGASMAVILREWTQLYEHRRRGVDDLAILPSLPVQYADYATWQRGWLQGEVLEAEIDYWRQRLAAVPALLELPTDRPRPPLRGVSGALRSFTLPEGASERLVGLGREVGATRFMVALAACQAFLSRLSGQTAVAVGGPVAGRDHWQLEGLVGMFVNTLVFAGAPEDQGSFRAHLEATRGTVLEAHDHVEVPFERLVEALQPQRSLDHTPLFQVLLTVGETTPGDSGAGEGESGSETALDGVDRPLQLRPLEVEATLAKFDLAFHLDVPRGAEGVLSGGLTYATDLFDATTAERWARGFAQLLAAVLEDPDAPLASHSLWSTAERHQQLVEWNDRGAIETPTPIPKQVVHQASTQPEAVAVWAGDASMSYGELLEESSRVAQTLQLGGAGVESRVAVRMERTPRLVAALLGVLRVGAAYVPIDPAYPPARQRLMLDDSAARWLLVDGLDERAEDWLPGWLAEQGSEAPEVLPWYALRDAEPGLGLTQEAPDLDSLAYVLYTSGSTGVPKGVAIPHRGPAALVDWARTVVPDRELAALVAPTSVCFDLSVFELFAPLAAGGTVQLVPDALHLPDEAAQPALVNTVPSVLDEGLSAAPLAPTVSTVSLAGEPLRGALVRRIFDETEAERILNLYGPSEDTTYSTGWSIRREDAATLGEPTVGRPILGKRAHVCGPDLRLQPLGVVGELCLSGVGLARGYLDRPATTATVFVPDPFSPEPGGRLYRTGDLARRLGDGELELLGRRDHQVKIRGFRIELEEIEARLLGHPSVAAAAVVAMVSESATDRQLVAWVVPAEKDAAVETTLRAFLSPELPHYLVPSRFETVESLPQTSSGKIDRRALQGQQLTALGPSEDAPFVAPRTVFEELVAGLWCEVLRVDAVSATADFFALGGHSLLATRLVARLERNLGLVVPVRWVFEAPTVQRFAARLETLRRQQATGEVAGEVAGPPPLVHDPEAPATLSFAQERLWFLEQLRPGTAAYNMPQALRLTGPVALPALEAALRFLVARHEPLRTRVARVEGQPAAQLDPPPPSTWRVPMVDLSGLPESQRQRWVDTLLAAEARRPFALDRDLPWRATLFRLAADDHALAWTLHHVVADGASLDILRREWGLLYALAAEAGPGTPTVSPLPPLSIAYRDHARWQRSWLQGEVLDAEIEHWRAQLEGAPELLELPSDRPRPPVPSSRGGTVRLPVSASTADALTQLARRHGATAFMVHLATYQLLLARLSGQDVVSVGAPIAGRSRWQVEGLVGLFVNTLVFAGEVFPRPSSPKGGLEAHDPSFLGLLGRTRERVLEAQDHQDLPFEKLVDALVGERHLDHDPLFQAALTVADPPPARPADTQGDDPSPDPPAGDGTLEPRPMAVTSAPAKFDLVLSVEPGSQGLGLVLSYASDLFDATTVQRWARSLRALLGVVVEQPDRPLRALPWMEPSERHQVLHEWDVPGELRWTSPRPAPAPVDELGLVERCFAWAAEQPELPAVAWGVGPSVTTTWTYAELAHRVRRVASTLRATDLPREGRVGLLLDRGPDLIAATLGTLAAGGAFVPLDPAYPEARLTTMVADAGLSVVLLDGPREAVWQTLVERWDGPGSLPMAIPIETAQTESDQSSASTELPVRVDPDQLAYVIFTSGTTGRPKGVGVPHRGLRHLVAMHGEDPALGPGDAALQQVSPSFDPSVLELASALAHGACLHTAPREALLPGRPLTDLLRGRGIDWVITPPPVLGALAPSDFAPDAPRTLLVGGEAAAPGLLAPWTGERTVINAYGPTEASVYASVWRAVPADLEVGRVGIGRASGDARLVVVDTDGRPTAVGVVGELWIGGPGLARGYLGRPAATAERFVPDPWSREPGSRWYRSGDLVRRWADGTLEHLGRFDHQLKIRGLRVESGEIEAALLAHDAVRQAVAVGVGERAEQRQLVAYVVLADGPEEDSAKNRLAARLRESLRERLPEALVPSRILALDAFPVTPNGKIDRQALAARGLDPQTASVAEPAELASRTPTTQVEVAVATLWQELLEPTRALTVDDDFFATGGTSLAAVRLVDRLAAEFAVRLPLAQIFRTPTLGGLAAEIELRRGGLARVDVDAPADAPITLRAADTGPTLWLVHGAGGTVFRFRHLARRWPGGAVQAFEARGLQDEAAPRRSVAAMAEAYVEALRRVQPQGPYHLLGWSLGGLVVWAMARRLEALGETVALEALVDTGWPEIEVPHGDDRVEAREWLYQFARELGLVVPRRVLGELLGPQGEVPTTVDDWQGWIDRAQAVGFDLGGFEAARLARLFEVFMAHVEAAEGAREVLVLPEESTVASGIRGDGGGRVYFAASTTDRRHAEAWRAFAGDRLGWHRLDGDHTSVLDEPTVGELVEGLVEAMPGLTRRGGEAP